MDPPAVVGHTRATRSARWTRTGPSAGRRRTVRAAEGSSGSRRREAAKAPGHAGERGATGASRRQAADGQRVFNETPTPGHGTDVPERVQSDSGAPGARQDWATIAWQRVKNRVKHLRRRRDRATQHGPWHRGRRLLNLRRRRDANLRGSGRRVTPAQHGNKTAGMAAQRAGTPHERVALVRQRPASPPWQVHPAKRLDLPTADGHTPRPLGMPTRADRVAPATVTQALAPSWAARCAAPSAGVRPGRRGHAALAHGHQRLHKGSDGWRRTADSRGACDQGRQEGILDARGHTPGRARIQPGRKAGEGAAARCDNTPSGTPPGGLVSPWWLPSALTGRADV